MGGDVVDGAGEAAHTAVSSAAWVDGDGGYAERGRESRRQSVGLHARRGRVGRGCSEVEHREGDNKWGARLGNLGQQIKGPGERGGIQDGDDNASLAGHLAGAPRELPHCLRGDLFIGRSGQQAVAAGEVDN